jgi:hypothetical protein
LPSGENTAEAMLVPGATIVTSAFGVARRRAGP